MNLKSISFEIKHQLKAKHTLLLFSKLHLFSSDKSITQAVVKAFVLVKGPLSPLDVSVGSFFRQISPRSSKFQLWTVKWLQLLSVWHLFYSLRYYLAMCLFGELSQVLTVNPNYTDSKAVSLSRETNPSNQDVDTTREVGFTVYTFLLSLTHGLVAGWICGRRQQHFILLVIPCHAVWVSVFPPAGPCHASHDRLYNEVEELGHIQHHADGRWSHHEDGEDGLFSWPGDETVHLVGARPLLALHQPGHLEAVVDKVERIHKPPLKDEPEKQAAGVGPPQRACNGQTPPL